MARPARKMKLLSSPALETGIGTRPDPFTPYVADVAIEGTAMILFHRYDPESVDKKSKAAKNSHEKKSDDIASYYYRCPDKTIGIPAAALKGSICDAARSIPDPRSPRKSARDLFRACIVVDPPVASLGVKEADGIDKRGVVIQRNRVTRSRPYMEPGWKVEFEISVLDPQYISPDLLSEVVARAGRFVGLCDHRPDFGRFRMSGFTVRELKD